MYNDMESVAIDGKEYPIKCDINVLIQIQERFENLSSFEMLLAGIKTAKDENGNVETDKNGKILFKRTEVSLKAINEILPCMLIEAQEESGGDRKGLQEAFEAIRQVKFDINSVAVKMHTEYSKCFERKNAQSAKEEKATRAKK